MQYSITYVRDHLLKDSIDFTSDLFNQEYEGMSFESNSLFYHSRLGKKTPTKAGFFLALWTKNQDEQNIPYSHDSKIDFLIVIVSDGTQEGYFSFPKKVLIEKGILSSNKHKGKMAFRVYTPWNHKLNPTAMKTQKWQGDYFIDTSRTES